MRTNDRSTLYIDFADFFAKDPELGDLAILDYYKHEPALLKGLYDFLYGLYPDYATKDKIFNLSFRNLKSVEK